MTLSTVGGQAGQGWNDHVTTSIDYIKFVPKEAFTIKNDEVWVKQVLRANSVPVTYNYDNLEWEMMGFSSQVRPATIRDLTAQTEVPAPQIYINMINNLPVTIQPNTVHTFYYRTKWTQGLDSSCRGNLDQAEVKQSDGTWKCESFVKETPIVQQCQVKEDCPILPECEAQKDLIKCEPRLVDSKEKNLCIYDDFTPQCKNQLITYQEKITEIENTKYVSIPSGTNSFFCFFDKTKSSCKVGEKTISVSAPSYSCSYVEGEALKGECWQTTLNFNDKSYIIKNNEVTNDIGFGIKAETGVSASLKSDNTLRDNWNIVTKFTLPDNFLDLKVKNAGNKFILQNSNEPITFTITNNLGFGIDGGYTIQTQNLALEGGVVLRDETKELFLKSGENDITYNFETKQLGTIVDLLGAFGKVISDREYIMKSSSGGNQKFLVLTKEVKTELPDDVEKVQPIEKEIQYINKTSVQIVKEMQTKETIISKIPTYVWIIISVMAVIILSLLGFLIFRKKKKKR